MWQEVEREKEKRENSLGENEVEKQNKTKQNKVDSNYQCLLHTYTLQSQINMHKFVKEKN